MSQRRNLNNQTGIALVETLVGAVLSVIVFLSLMSAFLAVNALNTMSKHNLQAIQVVRGEIERLNGIVFADIINSVTADVAYDPGPDQDFDAEADNLTGTLTVTVEDLLDMDADGAQTSCNNNASCIDLDGNGTYDSGIKPVRVAFAWTDTIFGQQKNFSVSADTLIAQ